jgi:hypothetical protein
MSQPVKKRGPSWISKWSPEDPQFWESTGYYHDMLKLLCYINSMFFKIAPVVTVIALSFFSSISGFARISPGQLMQAASSHTGHFKLERHQLIEILRNGNFRREQVAQFFTDRIYVLEIMESFLDLDSEEKFEGRDSLILAAEEKIFFRSPSYRAELNQLVGPYSQFRPSQSAINYGNYLKNSRSEIAGLHHWLFLIGETFGAQHISNYIAQKYPQVGEASKSFEDIKLIKVRGIFNKWIDRQLLPISENEEDLNYKEEIGIAYDSMTELFDAAVEAPHLSSYQSAVSAFSRLFNY